MQFFELDATNMAPLYKRYIPARTTADKPPDTPKAVTNVESDHATPPPEKKRKRERTQEELVERKAKKLKKNGIIDPADVGDGDKTVDTVDILTELTLAQREEQKGGGDVPQSEFAHVTSNKKRHKLEKEARNARKAAKKGASASAGDDESIAPTQSGLEKPGEAAKSTTNGADVDMKDVNEGAEDTVGDTEDGFKSKAKRRKRRKEEDAEGHVEEQDAGQHLDGPATAGLPGISSTADDISGETLLPKKRRHKLEGVVEQARSQDVSPEDEEHLRKHTAVLGKFQKSASRAIKHQEEESFEKLPEQPVVRHLELPEPERTPTPEFDSQDAALPPWLAKPTFVTSERKATFKDLNLEPKTAERLSKLGFAEALPVQQALVPLLMPPGLAGATYPPGTEDVLPDVAVSAPTGSGKTIAYLLPTTEALRHNSQHGKLSALIIVPTRELVMQVAAVAESLVKGSAIKVGMATGTGKFKDEQEKLVKRSARYDPAMYRHLVDSAKSQIYPPDEDSDEFQSYLEQTGEEDSKRQQWMQDTVAGLVNHVPTYDSAVDILVATPGRLLEHINNTLGFNLVHLQWLIIDEADKLLDNQYEGFLELLNAELTRPRSEEEQDSREKYLRSQALWDDRKERRLRKAILSATMTRDISKLTSLSLQRPKMIVVRGAGEFQANGGAEDENATCKSSVKESADGFELPRTLVEYCVPVGDGSEKPLVAVELLKTKILKDADAVGAKDNGQPEAAGDEDSGSDSDSDSDDSSNLSSDDSDSSSSASDTDEDSEDEDASAEQRQDSPIPYSGLPRGRKPGSPSAVRAPTVLIFTSSNESAGRLSHLLQGLQPAWKSWITTLTKGKPGKARIRSKADEPAIVISTDRAARGLDAFSNRSITHVIQYDVPRTLTSYVHRVGRTARAGRDGDAWTLYTHAEARWFVNEITKAPNVGRRTPAERIKLSMADDAMRERYQKVLAGMRDEVFGTTT